MSRADQAASEAAHWILAQEEPDWDQQDAFDAWLSGSDGNKAAYWRLKHSWREADRVTALGGGAAPADPVEPRARDAGHGARWWWPASIAASFVILVVGTLAWLRMEAPPSAGQPAAQVASQSFETDVGRQRAIGLADGSRLLLNTGSRVRTTVDTGIREVWLDQGEAYFEIAHQDGAPFVVHAGNRQVTVLGTRFSVRRDGGDVIVSVVEGRVRVDEMQGERAVRSTVITAGDIAQTSGAATLVSAHSDTRIANALAWREGMLRFEQQRLAEVAAEFNRYNRRPIVVEGAEAQNMRIGGMFPATRPDDFVRLLRDAYGLRVLETPDAVRISNE